MIPLHSRQTPIRDVMARHAPIAASATLQEAAARLARSRVDGLIVLRDDGSVAGVFSERDLVFAAHAGSEGASDRVGDHVNTHHLRAAESESIGDVLDRMSSASVRRAIVFDAGDNPTGLIAPEAATAADLGSADYILELAGERVGASALELGDGTHDPDAPHTPSPRITVGVAATSAARLEGAAGHTARLLTNPRLDRTGTSREVLRMRVVSVDVGSALVVGEPGRSR